MGELNPSSLRLFVREEFARTLLPHANPRRRGAELQGADVHRSLGRKLDSIDALVQAARVSPDKAVALLGDLALQMASLLFSLGADPPAWRRWSSLTSLALVLSKQGHLASLYAILGGEWELLKVLPGLQLGGPPQSRQFQDLVLWELVQGIRLPDLPPAADDVDQAWLDLRAGIPDRNFPLVQSGLGVIADAWMDLTAGDWLDFHPASFPDFETPVCAAAALARRAGLTNPSLTREQSQFLEAGLASLEPESLFPGQFTLPLPR